MTTYKGKDGVCRIGTSIVGEVKSFDLTETANEVNTSKMASNWTDVESTQTSWKGSLTMFWDPLDLGQIALVVGAKVVLELYPRGNAATLQRLTGTALITSKSNTQSFDTMVEATCEFTGSGALTKNVVP